MTTSSMPSSWCELEIGDVAEIVAGGTPRAADKSNFAAPGTEVSWLTPADLSCYKNKFISHGSRDLSQKGLDSSSAKLVPKGTLLFSSRAPIGYVAVAANEISTSQGFKNFLFTTGVDPSFAYYYLRSIRDLAESKGTGTTFKEISGATAQKLPFVVAPLAEQQQISARLDELLAQVETIKLRLDTISIILKSFRQSVLAAAVSGRLTEEWRNKNDVEEGREVSIGELCESSFYGPRFGKHDYTIDGIPTIRTTDMTTKGEILLTNDTPKIDVPPEKIEHFRVRNGDLLVTRTGSIGVMAIFRDDYIAIPSAYLIRFRFLPIVNVQFLYYFLTSHAGQHAMGLSTTTTTQPNINAKAIRAIKLTLPALFEQTEIVRSVEQLFAFADQIEQRVNGAHSRVSHLTQSILAKAFRGDLTAEWREHNPDLISGENSAKALLARIKAERVEAVRTKKTNRKDVKTKAGKNMKPKMIIPVAVALKAAGTPLAAQALLTQSGYSSDATTEDLERFFLDIREQLKLGSILRERSGDEDIFALEK